MARSIGLREQEKFSWNRFNKKRGEIKMEKSIRVLMAIVSLLALGFAFIWGAKFAVPTSRSAVYEIPMADRREPWRVTTYRNKVYVLIEAPSMPEDITRKEGPIK